MGEIINGKLIASSILHEVEEKLALYYPTLKSTKSLQLGIALLSIGNDNSTNVYFKSIKSICKNMNIYVEEYNFPQSMAANDIIDTIFELNKKDSIHGILIGQPILDNSDKTRILNSIDPHKDIDCVTSHNIGMLMSDTFKLLPCTVSAINELLLFNNINVYGKHCVIIGRSNVIGKPMAMELLRNNATITICHSKTENLKDICLNADILISAIGQPKYITSDMIKPTSIVIDVGISFDDNNNISGDIDFNNIKDITSLITPVPNGVGPITISMVIKNLFLLAKISYNK